MTREELVAKYKITEEGLQLLVNALLALPDSYNNRVILQKALKGTYSELSSIFAAQGVELQNHLAAAKKTEPAYDNLLENAVKGSYLHDMGAKPISSEEQSFDPRLFMNGATVSIVVNEERTPTLRPYPHVNVLRNRSIGMGRDN